MNTNERSRRKKIWNTLESLAPIVTNLPEVVVAYGKLKGTLHRWEQRLKDFEKNYSLDNNKVIMARLDVSDLKNIIGLFSQGLNTELLDRYYKDAFDITEDYNKIFKEIGETDNG